MINKFLTILIQFKRTNMSYTESEIQQVKEQSKHKDTENIQKNNQNIGTKEQKCEDHFEIQSNDEIINDIESN